jgi:hypothetical protein
MATYSADIADIASNFVFVSNINSFCLPHFILYCLPGNLLEDHRLLSSKNTFVTSQLYTD